jgi:hypothetical protein
MKEDDLRRSPESAVPPINERADRLAVHHGIDISPVLDRKPKSLLRPLLKAIPALGLLLAVIAGLVVGLYGAEPSRMLILGEGGNDGMQAIGSPPTSIVSLGAKVEAGEESSALEAGYTELPAEMPRDFRFFVSFGPNGASLLEVQPGTAGADYQATFLEAMSSADHRLSTVFSREEVESIYANLRDISFLTYPQDFLGEVGTETTGTVTDQAYAFVIQFLGVEHGVFWRGSLSSSPRAKDLRELVEHVIELLDSKQKTPE